MLLSDTTAYTPELAIAMPERELCLVPRPTADPIRIYLCGGSNRTIKITNGANKLAVQGSMIHYSVAIAGPCRIDLYNGIGRRVKRLVQENTDEGDHAVDLSGEQLATGLYLARMTTGDAVLTIPVWVRK